MSTHLLQFTKKLVIFSVMLILISPTLVVNDTMSSSENQQSGILLDGDQIVMPTDHLEEERDPGDIVERCPCPNYSSIVNMTNNNGSMVTNLSVIEGTTNVWTGDYPIDKLWIPNDDQPTGAIWEDIPSLVQEAEASNGSAVAPASHDASRQGADLLTRVNEAYDFFISDENGNADKWGQYLTIETYQDKNQPSNKVGGNIDAAYLLFEDGEKVYASSVVMFEVGTHNGTSAIPEGGQVVEALGPIDQTYTKMGNQWSRMVLCFGVYEDGSCQNATVPDPLDEDKNPYPDGCPCPQYDSIVNITGGPNNSTIEKFFAREGTGSTYVYETPITTWWVGSQPPVSPGEDIFIDIYDTLQKDESCTAEDALGDETHSLNYSGADLLTKANEAYDFFISDANGNRDLFGQFITIEVHHCEDTSHEAVGGNIDSAWLQLADGTEIFPSRVVHYEIGDNVETPPGDGLVENALSTPDGTFTKMGNNWSKIVLCFAEFWNGDCNGVSQIDNPFSQPHCDCPKYESLLGMQNLDGATIKSIGIREYTRNTASDISYDAITNFFGPSAFNAQNVHGAIGSYNLGNVPQWSPISNILIDTDNTAEYLLGSTEFSTGWDESRFTIVDDTGVGVTVGDAFANPSILSHGASVGGATYIYDLHTMEKEVYDFYVSDELGVLDEDGQYLAIEVNHIGDTMLASVGGNIDSVWIELTDGTKVYGKSIVYFQPGTYQSFSGYTNTVLGDGSEATGPPDGVYTSMGNGYSKMVVCFGVNESGYDIPLKLSLGNEKELDEKSESKHSSVLSGEIVAENMIDIAIGIGIGSIGAIFILRRK